MRPSRLARGILAGLALTAAPAHAQQEPSRALDAETALSCGVWAAMMSAAVQEEDKEGLNLTMTYFFGQYEALTGQGFDDALDARALDRYAALIQPLTETCAPIALALGNRMQAWGERIENEDAAAAADDDGPGS